MGSKKDDALTEIIQNKVSPSVYVRNEANKIMKEGMCYNTAIYILLVDTNKYLIKIIFSYFYQQITKYNVKFTCI